MPQRIFDALDQEVLKKALNYKAGYDWIPGRFGPPPGIPEVRKRELDNMSDKEYLYAFMRFSQEEKESLMISEAERIRTFAAHWPIEHKVKGTDVAKEGFYYTGIADKVQCAICCGVIRNWELGDVPSQLHRKYFSYCKMVLRKPCYNIPYDNTDVLSDLVTKNQPETKQTDSLEIGDLGISNNKPSNQAYSILSKRLQTFANFSSSFPVSAAKLCEAGFFYQGVYDRVTCFWCNGTLESWSDEDDPWIEHAKYYPGCAYVRQMKGINFIKESRAKMTKDQMDVSSTLEYNKADLSFLEPGEGKTTEVSKLITYRTCLRLGLEQKLVDEAFRINEGRDFSDIQQLISIIFILEVDGEDVAEKIKAVMEESPSVALKEELSESPSAAEEVSTTLRLEDIIKRAEPLTEEESAALVVIMTCEVCNSNPVGAVFLPCGHLVLCQACSYRNLPARCLCCQSVVKGACRLFLS